MTENVQISAPVRIGRPFAKGGDPRINKGGMDPKTRRLKKLLLALSPKAVAVVEALLDDEDKLIRLKAADTVLKYTAPKPTENSTVDVSFKQPTLSPEVAARLAALDSH